MKRGLFITLEGIDGSGKSTQFQLLVRYLRKLGHSVCATREPGGTAVGEQIRRILLSSRLQHSDREGSTARPLPAAEALNSMTELALMYAARAQHLAAVVRPSLARGEVVVSDRFNDASVAYQGYGRKLGKATVLAFDRIVCGSTQPDLTIVLDLAPRLALARALQRERQRKSKRSRFEQEGLKFQQRVRAGYLAIAKADPRRVKVVRADRPLHEVQAEIRNLVERALARRNATPKIRSRKRQDRPHIVQRA